MAVQQEHLRNLTAIWDQRAGIWQAVISAANRVPGTEVAPVLCNVEVRGLRAASMRLGLDERPGVRGLVVVRIGRCRLDGVGLYSRGRRWSLR